MKTKELGKNPQRMSRRRLPLGRWLLLVIVAALLLHGWSQGAKIDPANLLVGLGRLVDFLVDAFPPDLDRLGAITLSLLVTFEMALLGTIIGALFSLPLAWAAARNTSPHPIVYGLARGYISVCRTIPDMVWGLLFVIAVGLGPQAGVLALAVDTMGFCGRFFAEAIEEVDPGPAQALEANGASRLAVLLGGIVPNAMPSFIATSMFSLEQATRSSVVLGLVGAGGIGIELSVSMSLLRYDEAMTIILCIFVVVLIVERISAALRRAVLDDNERIPAELRGVAA
ncbi:phosphonate ABC transporter, permease protein PhnE [Enemella sp. A6]|uniref:phosphonate ABC transporter, permease protein PhnE n=1 Tax=Enemella sp. A6 TaxID=3440152 RepID=UPI003EBA8ADB